MARFDRICVRSVIPVYLVRLNGTTRMACIVGLTGGIGSGKSTVARILEAMGYGVFSADSAGHHAYTLEPVRQAVTQLLGDDSYGTDGSVDRRRIAELVFNDSEKLSALNRIIHPAVRQMFNDWMAGKPDELLLFREAAILFESGSHLDCDAVITVAAPESLRIQRVIHRDGSSPEAVKARLTKQMSDQERKAKADFEIINDEHHALIPQVIAILDALTSQCGGRSRIH